MVEEVFIELTRQEYIWQFITWPIISLFLGLLTGVFVWAYVNYVYKYKFRKWYRNLSNDEDRKIAAAEVESILDSSYKLAQMSNTDWFKGEYNSYAKFYAELDRMEF